MKKGGGMVEASLFLGSCVLLVVTGLMWLKREDASLAKIRNDLTDLRGLINEVKDTKASVNDVITKDLNVYKKITSVQEDLTQKIEQVKQSPTEISVVIKEPIKVLTKQVQPKVPIKTLPGLTKELKKKVEQLSQ